MGKCQQSPQRAADHQGIHRHLQAENCLGTRCETRCQNESQVTKSIKEARAIWSWVTLDAKALCFTTIKEAKAMCSHVTLDTKALCLATVKTAMMTQVHTIQEAKAACSTAIRDAEIQKASQAKLLQREHGKVMWDLEVQAIQEEGRNQADLLSHLPSHSVCQPSRAQRCTGCFLPCFIGADASISPICPITKDLSSGGTVHFSCTSCASAQTDS